MECLVHSCRKIPIVCRWCNHESIYCEDHCCKLHNDELISGIVYICFNCISSRGKCPFSICRRFYYTDNKFYCECSLVKHLTSFSPLGKSIIVYYLHGTLQESRRLRL